MSITQSKINGTVPPALEPEAARLQNRIKELENEIILERKKNAQLHEERDDYYRALLAWSRSQITEEQLHQWSTEIPAKDEQVPFEEIIADLRKGV